MNRLILTSIASLILSGTLAQDGTRWTNYLDATVGVGSNQGSMSVLYLHDWKIGKKQKFGFGMGARFSSYVGQNQYYSTAPAQLTSGSSSPAIIFDENIAANMDTLLVKSPQVNLLNIMINMDYSISSKWLIGFNIDAIGFSFGGSRTANYINGSTGKITEGSPTPFNVLLVSDNDKGSLNSELYVKYFLNEKWGVKAGAQFLFTEYTTITKVQTFPEENDRFRNKSLLFCFGVTYKL